MSAIGCSTLFALPYVIQLMLSKAAWLQHCGTGIDAYSYMTLFTVSIAMSRLSDFAVVKNQGKLLMDRVHDRKRELLWKYCCKVPARLTVSNRGSHACKCLWCRGNARKTLEACLCNVPLLSDAVVSPVVTLGHWSVWYGTCWWKNSTLPLHLKKTYLEE